METRYFIIENGYEPIEIKLGKDDWHYAQINASIRVAFFKYQLPLPKYVYFEWLSNFCRITIVRHDINSPEEANYWKDHKLFIDDELKKVADANSITMEDDPENWRIYTFKII